MVAYSFKKRFGPPILAGTKAQTIRAERAGRSRHARPGELVQLYTGMRTRQCRRLGEARCLDVTPVRLQFGRQTVAAAWVGRLPMATALLDVFARADGFASIEDMRRFWWAEHPPADGDTLIFEGVLIRWQPLAPAAALDIAGTA